MNKWELYVGNEEKKNWKIERKTVLKLLKRLNFLNNGLKPALGLPDGG